MTNKIAKVEIGTAASLPAPPALPMSAQLFRAYEDTARPHPDIGQPKHYPDGVRVEASRALEALQPYVTAVSKRIIYSWLEPIPFAVRNARSNEEIAAWTQSVIMALSGIAAGAFTVETQREALQTFKFFPSASDISDVVSPTSLDLRIKAKILKRIADTP